MNKILRYCCLNGYDFFIDIGIIYIICKPDEAGNVRDDIVKLSPKKMWGIYYSN